jgi:acetylornithine deacetylase/succinyl-diaminopimelate desuccinylase-like protein
MADLQQETTELLQRLIRFDTVNPPGNEREAIEFLRGYLEDAGLECELVALDEARPNLLARLRGAQDGPTLGLLSHVDTVLAAPGEWSHDPWSGDLADGCVWGRGALDMKSQTAAEAVAVATLAREGWRPARGELRVMCVVDEEAGGRFGAQFLTEQHADKVRCDYLINEGGGGMFEWDGRRHYGLCSAEKGVFRFDLFTEGVAGHASIPRMGDNALLKMAPLLQRLAERQPGLDVGPEPRGLLEALTGEPLDDDGVKAAVERLRERDPFLALLVEPTLGVSVTPTRIAASEKINVIPSRAEVGVDCRVPPGLGEEDARAAIAEVLGDGDYRIEFRDTVVGNRSPIDTELMEHIREFIDAEDPGAEPAAVALPGFSDSRWFREAFPECIAYGFFPQKAMDLFEAAPLVHGADERVPVEDLALAARFYAGLVEATLA